VLDAVLDAVLDGVCVLDCVIVLDGDCVCVALIRRGLLVGVTDTVDACVTVDERDIVCDLVIVRDEVCDLVCVGLVDFKIHTVSDETVHAAVCISFARQTVQAEQVGAFVVVL
jgi:hypothetical protein